MVCPKITNSSNLDLAPYKPLLNSFFPHSKKTLGYTEDPSLNFVSDPDNYADPLGKTAHYNPDSLEITIFVDGRHIKDILRSIAHELIHHTQNSRGEFKQGLNTRPGYAQEDGHMRGMEEEAYLEGNMLFRDWEDGIKVENKTLAEQLIKKEKFQLNERQEKLLGKMWHSKTISEDVTAKVAKKPGSAQEEPLVPPLPQAGTPVKGAPSALTDSGNFCDNIKNNYMFVPGAREDGYCRYDPKSNRGIAVDARGAEVDWNFIPVWAQWPIEGCKGKVAGTAVSVPAGLPQTSTTIRVFPGDKYVCNGKGQAVNIRWKAASIDIKHHGQQVRMASARRGMERKMAAFKKQKALIASLPEEDVKLFGAARALQIHNWQHKCVKDFGQAAAKCALCPPGWVAVTKRGMATPGSEECCVEMKFGLDKGGYDKMISFWRKGPDYHDPVARKKWKERRMCVSSGRDCTGVEARADLTRTGAVTQRVGCKAWESWGANAISRNKNLTPEQQKEEKRILRGDTTIWEDLERQAFWLDMLGMIPGFGAVFDVGAIIPKLILATKTFVNNEQWHMPFGFGKFPIWVLWLLDAVISGLSVVEVGEIFKPFSMALRRGKNALKTTDDVIAFLNAWHKISAQIRVIGLDKVLHWMTLIVTHPPFNLVFRLTDRATGSNIVKSMAERVQTLVARMDDAHNTLVKIYGGKPINRAFDAAGKAVVTIGEPVEGIFKAYMKRKKHLKNVDELTDADFFEYVYKRLDDVDAAGELIGDREGLLALIAPQAKGALHADVRTLTGAGRYRSVLTKYLGDLDLPEDVIREVMKSTEEEQKLLAYILEVGDNMSSRGWTAAPVVGGALGEVSTHHEFLEQFFTHYGRKAPADVPAWYTAAGHDPRNIIPDMETFIQLKEAAKAMGPDGLRKFAEGYVNRRLVSSAGDLLEAEGKAAMGKELRKHFNDVLKPSAEAAGDIEDIVKKVNTGKLHEADLAADKMRKRIDDAAEALGNGDIDYNDVFNKLPAASKAMAAETISAAGKKYFKRPLTRAAARVSLFARGMGTFFTIPSWATWFFRAIIRRNFTGRLLDGTLVNPMSKKVTNFLVSWFSRGTVQAVGTGTIGHKLHAAFTASAYFYLLRVWSPKGPGGGSHAAAEAVLNQLEPAVPSILTAIGEKVPDDQVVYSAENTYAVTPTEKEEEATTACKGLKKSEWMEWLGLTMAARPKEKCTKVKPEKAPAFCKQQCGPAGATGAEYCFDTCVKEAKFCELVGGLSKEQAERYAVLKKKCNMPPKKAKKKRRPGGMAAEMIRAHQQVAIKRLKAAINLLGPEATGAGKACLQAYLKAVKLKKIEDRRAAVERVSAKCIDRAIKAANAVVAESASIDDLSPAMAKRVREEDAETKRLLAEAMNKVNNTGGGTDMGRVVHLAHAGGKCAPGDAYCECQKNHCGVEQGEALVNCLKEKCSAFGGNGFGNGTVRQGWQAVKCGGAACSTIMTAGEWRSGAPVGGQEKYMSALNSQLRLAERGLVTNTPGTNNFTTWLYNQTEDQPIDLKALWYQYQVALHMADEATPAPSPPARRPGGPAPAPPPSPGARARRRPKFPPSAAFPKESKNLNEAIENYSSSEADRLFRKLAKAFIK